MCSVLDTCLTFIVSDVPSILQDTRLNLVCAVFPHPFITPYSSLVECVSVSNHWSHLTCMFYASSGGYFYYCLPLIVRPVLYLQLCGTTEIQATYQWQLKSSHVLNVLLPFLENSGVLFICFVSFFFYFIICLHVCKMFHTWYSRKAEDSLELEL